MYMYKLILYIGGRDYVGRPIISLTQPEQNGVEDLMELTDQELLDMFAYFTSVPRCGLNTLIMIIVLATLCSCILVQQCTSNTLHLNYYIHT